MSRPAYEKCQRCNEYWWENDKLNCYELTCSKEVEVASGEKKA